MQKTKKSAFVETAADKTVEQTEIQKEGKFEKPLRQFGGIYFHAGVIIGRKNVFVTNEYADLMANALKMAELKKDIKNLAYCVMPNFFYWIFKLSDKQNDPMAIYGDVKMHVAGEILKNLKKEVKDGKCYEMHPLFRANKQVGRSLPEKILWTFEDKAKDFENNKRYRVWAPKTGIRLIDTDELLQKKLSLIKNAAVSDRWKLVEKAEEYPYLYIADELADVMPEKATLADVLCGQALAPAAVPA